MDRFIVQLNEGAASMLKQALSFWMDPSLTPDVTTGPMSASIIAVQGAFNPLVLLAAFVGVVVAMVKVALTHRARPFGEAALMIASVIAVSGMAGVVTQLLLEWGDSFSEWIMTWSVASAGSTSVEGLFTVVPPTMLGVSLLTGTAAILASVIQVLFMLFRAALIPLLLVMLPFTAATSQTGAGKQAFHKMLGWLLAFVLYKPIAATVYSLGLLLISKTVDVSSGDEVRQWVISTISGLIILTLSILALPALIKFCAPLAGSGASSLFSGGTAMLAAAGVATGAVALGAAGAGASAGGAGMAAQRQTPTAAPTKQPQPPPDPGSTGASSAGGGPPALPAGQKSSSQSADVPGQPGTGSTGADSGAASPGSVANAPTAGATAKSGASTTPSPGSSVKSSSASPAPQPSPPPPRTGTGTPYSRKLDQLHAAQAALQTAASAVQGADRAIGYQD